MPCGLDNRSEQDKDLVLRGVAHGHYSIISSRVRLPSPVSEAASTARIALAVRPCLPITLPKSSWATRNSMRDVLALFLQVHFNPLGMINQFAGNKLNKFFHLCRSNHSGNIFPDQALNGFRWLWRPFFIQLSSFSLSMLTAAGFCIGS